MVDTLETVYGLGHAPGALPRGRVVAAPIALASRGTPALVMCHVSHVYPTGASLYFTFLAAQESGAELEQWYAAKSAVGDAIVAAEGTITHHHAVGRDHAPWLEPEIGAVGADLLRARKGAPGPPRHPQPGQADRRRARCPAPPERTGYGPQATARSRSTASARLAASATVS